MRPRTWRSWSVAEVRADLARLEQDCFERRSWLQCDLIERAIRSVRESSAWLVTYGMPWWPPRWKRGVMQHEFEAKKKAVLQAVGAEKDAKKAVKSLLQAQHDYLREQFLEEKRQFDAAHEEAIAGLDAADAGLEEAVAAVFANTGH